MRTLLTLILALVTAPGVITAAPAPPADAASAVVKVRLREAVNNLPLALEHRTGYDRDLFRHWIDANHDCQDTRDEVLDAESRVDVSGCDIRTGRWLSYYDRAIHTYSGNLDIDHLVPLAEAWDSGARRWNADTRRRFANDLGDRRSLVAVTAAVNRSKSDQDPAEWMPRYGKCRYVREWVAVKIRWSLKVDRAEKRALAARAATCRNTILRVRKASVTTGSGGTTGGTGGGSTGLDPRFDYCYQAKDAGYGPYYQGTDPEYDWYTDSDSDGVVCE